MENQFLCTSSNDQRIRALSNALLDLGIADAAHYYEADEYSVPYFKLGKKFKKESPADPDFHYLYVDVDEDEYTVHGQYGHEHFADAVLAAWLVKALFTGETVEVALVFPDKMAGFFMNNTGDPEQNVKVITDNAKTIMDILNSPSGSMRNVHVHTAFAPSHPYFLLCGGFRRPQIADVTIYMVSYVFAEHPEYYVIQ